MGGTWQQGWAVNPHSASPQRQDAFYTSAAPGPGFHLITNTLQKSISPLGPERVKDSKAQ